MAKGNRYTKAIADKICARIADGESLNAICKDSNMPHRHTVMEWALGQVKVADKANFPDKYARARKAQADAFADEIVDIADTEPDPNKARIRIDARKWVAGKQRPKKYGDRSKLEVTGEDGNPIENHFVIEFVSSKDGGKSDD